MHNVSWLRDANTRHRGQLAAAWPRPTAPTGRVRREVGVALVRVGHRLALGPAR